MLQKMFTDWTYYSKMVRDCEYAAGEVRDRKHYKRLWLLQSSYKSEPTAAPTKNDWPPTSDISLSRLDYYLRENAQKEEKKHGQDKV